MAKILARTWKAFAIIMLVNKSMFFLDGKLIWFLRLLYLDG